MAEVEPRIHALRHQDAEGSVDCDHRQAEGGYSLQVQPQREAFLSTTIQFIQQNLDSVKDWVESEVHRTGLPVLVFIDECHSASITNEWGQIVPVLTEAGAHVVLLTATPERADFTRIPGFEFDEVDEEEITIFRSGRIRRSPRDHRQSTGRT